MRHGKFILDLILVISTCYLVSTVFVTGNFIFAIPGITGKKIEVSEDQFRSGLIGIIIKDAVYLTQTDDPMSMVHLDSELNVEAFEINISKMNVSITNAQIYYAPKDKQISGDKYINHSIRVGSNIIVLNQPILVKKIRFDLADKAGISMSAPQIFIYTYHPNAKLVWLLFGILFTISMSVYATVKRFGNLRK